MRIRYTHKDHQAFHGLLLIEAIQYAADCFLFSTKAEWSGVRVEIIHVRNKVFNNFHVWQWVNFNRASNFVHAFRTSKGIRAVNVHCA